MRHTKLKSNIPNNFKSCPSSSDDCKTTIMSIKMLMGHMLPVQN